MTDVLTSGQRAVTQPAVKALGYGNRAAGSGTRVAQAPARQATPPPKPAHVVAAEAELQKLPNNVEITVGGKKVKKSIAAIKRQLKIHDMKDYRKISPAVAKAGFDAWTSSRVDVWVAPSADGPDHKMRAVMFHEVLHIIQFRLAKSPPKKYEVMVRFECAAYGDTADWLAVPANHPGQTTVTAWEQPMRGVSTTFCNQLTAITTKNATKRDLEFRRFLVGSGMLPAHNKIGDLYP